MPRYCYQRLPIYFVTTCAAKRRKHAFNPAASACALSAKRKYDSQRLPLQNYVDAEEWLDKLHSNRMTCFEAPRLAAIGVPARSNVAADPKVGGVESQPRNCGENVSTP
jgi:hypothetical protein